MADSSFPFSSGPGASVTDDQWSRMASLWAPDGVAPSSPPITLAAGLTFTVPVGFAAFTDGFYYEVTSDPVTKTAVANANSLPRRDRLVLRKDLTAKTVTPVIVQGAPSSGTPPLPAVGANDMLLGYATCPGSGSAQNYSDLVLEHGVTGYEGDQRPTLTAQLLRSDGQAKLNPSGTTDLKLTNVTQVGAWALYVGRGISLARPGRYRVETVLQTGFGGARYIEVSPILADPVVSPPLLADTSSTGFGTAGGSADFMVPAGKTFQMTWSAYSSAGSEADIRGSRVQITWLGP